MTDLFDYQGSLGFKDNDTSRTAAESMADSAPILRQKCLSRLRVAPATADEVAEDLCLSVLSVRPRFTELLKGGAIVDTGNRRPNASGRMAKVWGVAA